MSRVKLVWFVPADALDVLLIVVGAFGSADAAQFGLEARLRDDRLRREPVEPQPLHQPGALALG